MAKFDEGFQAKFVRPDGPALADGLLDPAIAGYGQRLKQWMLRLLIDSGVAWSESFNQPRFVADTGRLLPVPEGLDGFDDEAALAVHYRKLRESMRNEPAPAEGPLARNLAVLGSSLRMNQVEQDILAMLVIYRAVPPFEHLVDQAFPKSDSGRMAWQLSTMLGHSQKDIDQALASSGVLMSAGLTRMDESCMGMSLPMILELNRRVLRLLTHNSFGVSDLLAYAARPCRSTDLVLADFDHMGEQRDLVMGYLQAVKRSGIRPASILFDGPPGVGKTQLARLAAEQLGFQAYEINEVDNDGDPAMPGERVNYLRICQRMIERGEHNLIIFDEADALMGGHLDDQRRNFRGSKAGLLHLLESLSVPVIWITNHGDMIDPAVLRRIDLTVRFRRLPREARERMLRKAVETAPDLPAWLERLSKAGEVTPARIAQADKVARLMADGNAERHTQLFRQVIEENLDLGQGKAGRSQKDARSFELPYRLETVNADEDLGALVGALRSNPIGRLCLYGPPGTGKTRFVKHLSEACDLKLSEYRASDLMDKWVGSSERNIRRMFEECDRPDQLLFLDEADSLMASRKGARQSWEVNQVNELLKGLEGFQGLFVASTNLMEKLDSAVMRRLDFKIHFGYLAQEQRWRLFLDLAAHVGLKVRGTAATRVRQVVDRLDCLTPGDFAMLARRLSLRPSVKSCTALAELLEKEMRLKPEVKSRTSIGFTAAL